MREVKQKDSYLLQTLVYLKGAIYDLFYSFYMSDEYEKFKNCNLCR